MSEPTTHDFTNRYWGHSIEFMRRQENGDWLVCVFLSRGIRPGDFVLAASESGGNLRYRVVGDVRSPIDPGDQHFTTLRFVEREATR